MRSAAFLRLLVLAAIAAPLLAGDPPVPAGGFPIVAELDLPLTYADGFKTRVDVRYPDPAKVRAPASGWPCLLAVHPLTTSRKIWKGKAAALARRGYLVLAYDVRGQGDTIALNPGKGTTLIADAEKADMAEVFHKAKKRYGTLLDFARLGVFGDSQGGIHSFAAAAWSERKLPAPRGAITHFPKVLAVVPRVTAGDMRPKLSIDGNAFAARLLEHVFGSRRSLVLDASMQRAMQSAFLKQDFAAWNAIVNAPTRRDADLLKTSRVPVLSINATDDYWNQAWLNLRTLQTMPATTPTFFCLTTGNHGTPRNTGEEATIQQLLTRWFDHFLKGVSDELVRRPRHLVALTPDDVSAYKSASTRWMQRRYTSFPARPATALRTYWLRSQGGLASSPPTGSEPADLVSHKVAPGFTPLAWTKTGNVPRLVAAQIPLSSAAFRSAPLAADRECVGRPRAELTIDSTAPNLQLWCALLDEAPNGVRRYVAGGPRALRGRKPGARALSVELGLAAYVFRKGHRVVLSVENHAYHRPAGQQVLTTAPFFESYVFRVVHTKSAPSRLVLPLEELRLGLRSSAAGFSATTGATLPFVVDGGAARAGDLYFVLVSASGIVPGTSVPGGTLALNVDPLTSLALGLTGTPLFRGFAGLLDAAGRATPSSTVPAGLVPASLAETPLSFAALSFDAALKPSTATASDVFVAR